MPRHIDSKLLQSILSRLLFVILATYAIGNPTIGLVDGGTSSTPKNLVNLSEPEESGGVNGLNLTTTSSNQFQNEYQYNRQSTSKSISSERHKSSTTSLGDVMLAPSSSSFDHLQNEFDAPSELDSRVVTNAPYCEGRLRLNGTRGYITDGPGYYQTNLQCIWLIDSGMNNATIRIQLHQFNTECNYDFLYLFDGDSVYSPLVAALSGDKKDFNNAFEEAQFEDMISTTADDTSENPLPSASSTVQSIPSNSTTGTSVEKNYPLNARSHIHESQKIIELKTHSGKAFIYFHSDTALSMPGFYMTYSIDSCPLDCSNRGDCNYRTLTCKCYQGYFGDGCQNILCPNNCTSPIHGTCDKEKSCVCNHDFIGADCSRRADQQHWTLLLDPKKTAHARAFHQAAIIDNTMWIFGGKSPALSNTNTGIFKHKVTPAILSFDLLEHRWNDNEVFFGETGRDHLAELSGHSAALSGTKVFIFGGMAMNNTILNTLTVFDTKTKIFHNIGNKKGVPRGPEEEFAAPLSVVGHSANIIDGYMYVFWGYNPTYGYLNFAQKFNIANNSWSIVERHGSSVSGCIGHTSTFDLTSRLVYIYGGHNALKSNRLYSFNPQTEVWTYLHSSPSHRYYHSAIIMNGLLTILGGNSYNTSHHSNQCFQQTHLVYDLKCSSNDPSNQTMLAGCSQNCWTSMNDDGLGVMKRHGHTVVSYNNQELLLYGGFNGILLNDLRSLKVQSCSSFTSERECMKPKLGVICSWNTINSACEVQDTNTFGQSSSLAPRDHQDCTKNEIKKLQMLCEARETCTDCLHTNLGCVWCGLFSQCQHGKCISTSLRAISKPEQCYRNEVVQDPPSALNDSSATHLLPPLRASGSINSEQDYEVDCRVDNCYLCQSKPYCSWQNDGCVYSRPSGGLQQSQTSMPQAVAIPDEIPSTVQSVQFGNSSRLMQRLDPYSSLNTFNRSLIAAIASTLLNSAPYSSCDSPCFTRRSCNECTTTKCIWCSTTEQCIDSTAYFAYHSTGQCMHYVAHMLKCPMAACSDIETCDKCLTNPKCGWLNDISNTGKGRCMEGTSSGPTFSLGNLNRTLTFNDVASATPAGTQMLPNWYYTSCPNCQCNGHSYCRTNSSACVQPCQDFTEGLHCDRCIAGYHGDPVNGGTCRPCRCNGHAHTCNRETGKCYCSTKGIIGHNCNRCDDKNYYIGDPSSPGNGTCYYNLTTDYQYTFNMSKPEDHFYSEINFINVPIRKDSDADFSIACSRLALVNITSGTSYKSRRPIQTGLECGSFRLRFPHDRHAFNEANYSFFVHVYKFQTPLILQISFSQHRTLYLPQFFFTFSSCFLFFFALSGLVLKLKHEYDLYVRRQRQFIEMEQMASRPFSTILLEMFRPGRTSQTTTDSADRVEAPSRQKQAKMAASEPTPISFEPCFGGNVGVLSLFVQLPGRPNLAIGSALVSLNEDLSTSSTICDSVDDSSEQANKRHESSKDL